MSDDYIGSIDLPSKKKEVNKDSILDEFEREMDDIFYELSDTTHSDVELGFGFSENENFDDFIEY